MAWVDYRSFETDCRLQVRAIGEGADRSVSWRSLAPKLDSVTSASAL
jgi:hypothetical protein